MAAALQRTWVPAQWLIPLMVVDMLAVVEAVPSATQRSMAMPLPQSPWAVAGGPTVMGLATTSTTAQVAKVVALYTFQLQATWLYLGQCLLMG